MPEEAQAALAAGAEGIGLFRSEFLFMNQEALPDEEAQFVAYRQLIVAMQGRPVTIRTLDIGADKPLDYMAEKGERGESTSALNPALGLRAIRWSLAKPQIFLTQLRAILRAAVFGPVRILLPMITHAYEIDQAVALLKQARTQCIKAGFAYGENIKIGAMLEVPAAILALPVFLKRVDFLSIGTNDLTQYTLAIDRADAAVAHLYDSQHSAVLQLIARAIREATDAGIPIEICGEMAGNLAFTRLLLGMGLTEFSMHPNSLLRIKEEIMSVRSLSRLRTLVDHVLSVYEPEEVAQAIALLRAA